MVSDGKNTVSRTDKNAMSESGYGWRPEILYEILSSTLSVETSSDISSNLTHVSDKRGVELSAWSEG